MYSWSLVIFSFDNCLHKHQTSFLDLHCFFNHQARVCKRFFAFQFMMKIILIFNKADRNHQLAVWWHKKIRPNCDVWVDKTQCQLCKRLAEPFIPLSWSCLVSKRVSLWMWSPGGSQQPFSCVLGPFSARSRPTNQVILEQACSSLRRQSFAKSAISVGDGFPYQDWTSHFPASWKWRRLTQYGDGYVHDNDHLTQAILLAPKVLLEDRWHMMTSWPPISNPNQIPQNEWMN